MTLHNDIVKEDEVSLGKRRRVGAEARALFNYKWLNITVGGDLKFDVVNNKNILSNLSPTDVNENIYGVFADAEVRPVKKLILGAGVRYDYYDIPDKLWGNSTSKVSPRASDVSMCSAQSGPAISR